MLQDCLVTLGTGKVCCDRCESSGVSKGHEHEKKSSSTGQKMMAFSPKSKNYSLAYLMTNVLVEQPWLHLVW